jgi:hypothetical protein
VSEIKVQGGRQGFSSRLIGQAVAACVPGAQAATIEAAGHMAIVADTDSDVVNAVYRRELTVAVSQLASLSGS